MALIRNDLLSNERMLDQEELRENRRQGAGVQQARSGKRYVLDHKKFEQEIPDFLNDSLNNEQLSLFLRHFDECPVCRDELYIQYLVIAGLPKLETGETFNLQKEVDGYIAEEKSRLFHRRHLQFYAYFLETITLLAAAAAAAAGVIYFR